MEMIKWRNNKKNKQTNSKQKHKWQNDQTHRAHTYDVNTQHTHDTHTNDKMIEQILEQPSSKKVIKKCQTSK